MQCMWHAASGSSCTVQLSLQLTATRAVLPQGRQPAAARRGGRCPPAVPPRTPRGSAAVRHCWCCWWPQRPAEWHGRMSVRGQLARGAVPAAGAAAAAGPPPAHPAIAAARPPHLLSEAGRHHRGRLHAGWGEERGCGTRERGARALPRPCAFRSQCCGAAGAERAVKQAGGAVLRSAP